MARYVKQLQVPYESTLLAPQIEQFMTSEGFYLADYKGETVWKKGVGVLTAPQYLSVTYGPNTVTVQAFIKYALLPGVYIGEMGIDGFFGAIPKQNLKKRVVAVEQLISSFAPAS